MAIETTTREPITMAEAVGYTSLDCAPQSTTDNVLTLKHDRIFLRTDARGNVAPPGQCGLGLFLDDTRILSHYALSCSGGEPLLLSAQVTAPWYALVDLSLTDRMLRGEGWDTKNVIHIRRSLLLDDRLVEALMVTSHLIQPIDFRIGLDLASDFADIFEVRGWKRKGRGQYYAPEVTDDSLLFTYRGVDDVLVGTWVRFHDRPTEIGPRGARWNLRLQPGVRLILRWEIGPGLRPPPRASGSAVSERQSRLAATYAQWRAECARWRTDTEEFNRTLEQAVDDLRALYIQSNGHQIISAGTPWYTTAFGRDAIITSLQTLSLNPRIAIDTLRYLAAHQGRRENSFTEEQPGKIMHELRRGEMARAGEIPHLPYYGTIDATPLWLVLLHETWRWTGDEALMRELLPNAERALEWIDRYGDIDGDGFVEYMRTSPQGLVNQGWKDSWDGVPFPDGRLPEPPIALVEVQGYVYDAKLRMAQLFEQLGHHERAQELAAQAAALRQKIHEKFWLEDFGTFALALDGAKRPIPTITTNAGHLLWSRVPDARQAARMVDVFFSQAMFSGWGIRTLSADHPVYNPMSYHNGSVWPHDNAILVLGLSICGHAAATLPVLSALQTAAIHMGHRLPELFCGMRRAGGMRPVLYPVSCSPQAWASGAFFMMLQGVLGLLADAPQRVLHIREPQLPRFTRELTVSRLRVGGSRVALRFRRHGDRTLVNLLSLEGEPLRVQIELA